jgi:hypothetical protein
LLLYYPLPRYFFVARSPAGEALAKRVEAGLNRMLADGSFDQMFNAYKKPILQRLKLGSRRLLRIANPTLPSDTPLARKELWFDPIEGSTP